MRLMAFAGAAAFALALTETAFANGRYPAANQLVVSPSDPSELVLRATFGAVFSRDHGATWDWVCESAMGYRGEEDPSISVTSTGNVLVGSLAGLYVSDAPLCSFRLADPGFQGESTRDSVVRKSTPGTAYAVTSTYVGAGGALTYRSQVYVSRDGGGTWAKDGAALDPSVFVETIEVSESDAKRLYIGGVTGPAEARTSVLLVSRDEGATWATETVPTANADEHAAFVSAVDPSNADRVYVRTEGVGITHLLVTDDAGKTFRSVFEGHALLGFALSPDGSKVFVGSPEDGLHEASRADMAFAKRSNLPIRCLTANGDSLFACTESSAGFVIGESKDDGATFAPTLTLAAVRGPAVCPSGGTTDECAAEWPGVKEQLANPEQAGDGGSVAPVDAGADADAGTAGGAASSGGCAMRGGPRALGLGALGVAAMLALIRIARRRRGPTSS